MFSNVCLSTHYTTKEHCFPILIVVYNVLLSFAFLCNRSLLLWLFRVFANRNIASEMSSKGKFWIYHALFFSHLQSPMEHTTILHNAPYFSFANLHLIITLYALWFYEEFCIIFLSFKYLADRMTWFNIGRLLIQVSLQGLHRICIYLL